MRVPLIIGLALMAAFAGWALHRTSAGTSAPLVNILPDASMITRISQQVGGPFGVAVSAVVLESAAASGHALTHAFDQAFWWVVGFTVVAALASLLLPAMKHMSTQTKTSTASQDRQGEDSDTDATGT